MTNLAPRRAVGTPALTLAGVSKSFDNGATFAVRDVSLTVSYGQFISLVGGSGSGKTTTLKILNRLIEADAGEVRVGGKRTADIPGHELRRRIGYVFQGVGLFPHLTVAENVAATPRLLGWPDHEIAARVDSLLDLVELAPDVYRSRFPAALSGGQRQRVGFARALAATPQIVLMDEPFGALDPITRDSLSQAYMRLHDRFGLTTIMVTHDLNEALLLSHLLGVMQEGRLVAFGEPSDLLARTDNAYVRDLLATPRMQAERIAEKFGVRAPHDG